MKIYETRYKAKKAATGDDVVVKVEGGYTVRSASDYQVWKRQK